MGVWEARITNDLRTRKFLRGYWKSLLKYYPNEYTASFKAFITALADKAEAEDYKR